MNLLKRGVVRSTKRGVVRSTATSRRPLCTHQQQQEHQGRGPAEEGNITKQNFWSSLETFKAHLCSADFVGFDLELSGINSLPPYEHCQASRPSPSHRSYCRIKHLAEKFAVLQVGLALFRLDPAYSRFFAYPYNFYVFPRNDLSLGLPAATFSCESASLEFLASHGFDFNLCVQDGMSYLSKTQEADAREWLANEHVSFKLKSCGCNRSANNTSDVVFSERLRLDLEKWHNKISTSSSDFNTLGSDLVADISAFKLVNGCQIKDFKVPPTGVLSKCPSFTLQLENHHQVCLAQLVVDRHFKDIVLAARSDCVSGASHAIKVFLTKSKEHFDIVKNELEQGREETKINEAIGFRHIVDAVVSSRKPLIGHNCALDLAHIHNKFLSPLPSSTEEFSASLLAHFPSIIDTKYLMKFEPSLQASWARKHTSLSTVYSHMCKSKDIKVGTAMFAGGTDQHSHKAHIDIMPGFKRYQDGNSNLHEAGFDAFMTGCVFAQICHQRQIDVKSLLSTVHDTPTATSRDEFTNLLNFGHGILDLRTGKLRERDAREKKNQELHSFH